MAFGSLASFSTTSIAANILYSAPSSKFSEGKVYVVNMNSFPVRIRIGIIGTTNINDLSLSNYIVYNQDLNVGQSFVSHNIFLKNGESIVVKSDLSNVKFSFRGSEVGVTTTTCGILTTFSPAQSTTIGAGITAYVTPVSMVETDANLYVVNTSPEYIKVNVGIGTTIGSNHYIVYNERVEPGKFFCKDNVKLGAGEIIFVKSTSTNVNIVALGKTTHR